jgi:hypothetical protein
VRERQQRSRKDDEQHPVCYELDVSSKRQSGVRRTRDEKAPHQSDQHKNCTVNQNLPTAAVNVISGAPSLFGEVSNLL